MDGTVSQAGFVTRPDGSPSYGWVVFINHAIDGYSDTSIYAHLFSAPLVSSGQIVTAGTHIGEMGTSGNSTGVHLHFETRRSGTPIDPLANYFPNML